MAKPDSTQTSGAAAPVIRKRAGISLVWLIPLVTLIIGGWLIFKTLSEKGPEITIAFKTAEGIEAGKTKIKYKDIEIGVVTGVSFNADFSNVILSAELNQGTEQFLRRDTKFWVVKPKLSLRGASGLSTLISGSHIVIDPGQGEPRRAFTGLDEAPLIKMAEAGKKVVLQAKRLGSLDMGSPVYYQGLAAGEVLGYELANDQESVFIYAFIKAPFDELVRSNTQFWNVSGMDISMGAKGFDMHMESVQSLLFGGIAFETPDSLGRIKKDVDGLVFTLYENHDSISEHAFIKKLKFIAFFDSSVRGLAIGAPVEFKGIKVGSVVDLRLEFNRGDVSFRIPVLVEIEPERIIERGVNAANPPDDLLKQLVDHGLRASLKTGSLLTGQLFVALDMHPGSPLRLYADKDIPFPELPTIAGGLDQMTASATRIMRKLESIDVERISREVLQTLSGINKLVNTQDVNGAILEMKKSMIALQGLMKTFDRQAEPLAANVSATMVNARETLKLINRELKSGSSIMELADELTETARSIRALVDLLERNPDSAIFGKRRSGD